MLRLAFLLSVLLLQKGARSGIKHAIPSYSQDCTCTVLGSEITCTGSGTLTKDVVQKAGTYTKYTKATIEGNIYELAGNAFVSCARLVEVVVTAPVTTYGHGVFDGAPLPYFKFGKEVTSIVPQVFNNAKKLRWIDVEAGNKNYCAENGILYNSDKSAIIIIPGNLTSVTIISSVKLLTGGCNVWSCMDRIIIPDNVIEIGIFAFYQSDLSYAYIGSGVTTIHTAAFESCTKLSEVEVSSKNKNFDSTNGIFGHGTSTSKSSLIHISWTTTEITLNSSVKTLGAQVFNNARALKTIKNQAGVTLDYSSPDGLLVVKGDTIVGCAGAAESVTIPTTIKAIESSSFRNLRNLTTVTFTNNVTLKPDSVFRECSQLSTINWGNCKPYEIHSHYFVSCAVDSLAVPSSVVILNTYAFHGCSSTSVSLPGVQYVRSYAFSGSPYLKTVDLPAIKDIQSGAFWRCQSLMTINFGSSLQTIASSAFSECSSLQRVDIPAKFTNLMAASFSYCDSLTEIKIHQNSVNYCDVDGVVYNKAKTMILICPSGLTSITLPSSTVAIGEQSFCGCGRLTEVIMNDDIESINGGAFYDCGSIRMVRIPGKIKFIGTRAFESCGKLQKILYCNNKDCDRYEGDPFPTSPEIWVFYDYTSSKNNTFCGHEVVRLLDYECNIPTAHFSDFVLRRNYARMDLLFGVCNLFATVY